MSTRRPTSWASVVATGIIEEPLLLPACVRSPPPKSTYNGSLTKASGLTIAEPVEESASQSQLLDTPPLKHSRSASPTMDSHSSSNPQSSSQDFGRPFRIVWPRQASQDNQHHHRSNSHPSYYRLCWHHNDIRTNYAYGSGHNSSYRRQPRYKNPKHPWSHTTFFNPMPESYENESGSQFVNSNEESALMESQTYEPNVNDSDDCQSRRACVSPRARDRCQVPFSSSECALTEWQSIAESRRVWEPLDRNQLHMDPSSDILLLSGLEHLPYGKTSLSTRARQLMGEQVKEGSHTDYPTPTPMTMPEVSLREHLWFIGNYDTHLTKYKAQLRVTNGTIGDGYYVSQSPKLMPISMFLCPPASVRVVEPSSPSPPAPHPSAPKHRVFRPGVSYWDLLRYNQETGSQVDFSQDFGTVYFNGQMNQYGNEANQGAINSQMLSDYIDQESLPECFHPYVSNYMDPNNNCTLATGATDALSDDLSD